jgi:hypothetical protein
MSYHESVSQKLQSGISRDGREGLKTPSDLTQFPSVVMVYVCLASARTGHADFA